MGAKIDACHILHPHKGAVGIGSNHDVPKFLRRLQSSLCANGVGKLLPFRNRFASDLPGGIHVVLVFYGGDNFRDGDAKLGQLVWFDPHLHRVLSRAKDLHIRNAGHARELIDEIDVAVVGEKDSVVGLFR